MKYINKKILLLLIILIASIIRLWQLGGVPPSPNWDEVSLGYNAYSILNTGRDEYGSFLPIVLRSFDDYKPGLYTYLIIPFINIFDLTAFTVRLPSAIMGVVGVVAAFFLVRILFEKYRYRDALSILAAFLLAISPISIQVSRIAFETNVGMVFNLFAALSFLHGLKRGWPLIFAAVFAALALYTYQSEKVFTPLFMLLLLAVYWNDFWKVSKKYIFGSLVVGLVFILPMLFYMVVNPESLLRAQATSVLSDKTNFLAPNIERLELDIARGDKVGQFLDNRRFEYFKASIAGYISHLDPNWIFITGDLTRHHAPSMGLLYQFELPFFLLGIYLLLFGGFATKTKLLIFGWFLLAPIPAAFTTGVPHALRTLNFLPTFQIFVAIGLIAAFIWVINIKGKVVGIKISYGVLFFASIIFTFNFMFYINQYFSQQNYFYGGDWQYGWEKAVEYAEDNEDKYDRIIISSKEPLDQAHMFFAFYLKYPPGLYQKSSASKQFGGFGVTKAFGKYEFVSEVDESHFMIGNALIIATPAEIAKSGRRAEREIFNPDGSPVIGIISTSGFN